ncbi:hypothetical protein GZH47_32975 (plasmid) [Paenibacillus rhizovicinus]|uniref:Uncharacterized protein n=1 Tax=Paenibacillus rhizovicinus TaxID=2704463 RepID=A0A6C0PB10_9BACL|nr:hypothetical protein [Paenibacillus rhizovicinus]QHW35708.1 hypothetical protein GZH47_32975 [Paenibacillus rhizovicinus]
MELVAGYMNSFVIPDPLDMLPGSVYRFEYTLQDGTPVSFIAECMKHWRSGGQDRIQILIFYRSGGHGANILSLYSERIRNIRLHWNECKHNWALDEREDKCFCEVCGIWEDEL